MAPPLARALSRRAAWAAAGTACLAALLAWRTSRDPRRVFLSARRPAAWIEAPRPVELRSRPVAPEFARFRARFAAGPAGVAARLVLRPRREAQVVLDGKEASPPGGDRTVDLRAGPGEHELLIVVRAAEGPAVLWAQAPALGLYTGPSWQASGDGGKTWLPAADASAPPRTEEFAGMPSAARGFLRTLWWTLPLLLVARRRASGPPAARAVPAAAGAAWLALAASCLARLPPGVGFDAAQHVDYVRLLAETGRLPGPGDGWQTFQAPLYHLLSAPLLGLGEPGVWLRLPSLLAGFALGGACLAFVRAVRPGKPWAAAAAGLLGWFLPASLYSAQAPGNEPMAAAFAAWLLARAARPGGPLEAAEGAGLGALCGLALLSKATAVLALPPALLLLWPRRSSRGAAAFAVAALATGGWFYLRSWALHGAPFVGGWDPARGIAWQQDPGVRSAGDLLRFGAALASPFYAGLNGFWDALYSTWWCDGWQSGVVTMLTRPPRPALWQAALAWWSLLPTALIALGARAALRREDAASGAALLGWAGGLAAMLWLFLSVPVYSTVKGTYLLGLLPLAALLAADGLESLPGRPRAAAWGGLAAWAFVSWRAFLVQ